MVKEGNCILHAYTDGGSRGNPGNAAIAFAIYDDKGNVILEKSKSIGVTTNNVAEYRAMISALEAASNYCRDEVLCFSDSEHMVKQLNGKKKVKKLKKWFDQAKEIEKRFKKVTYSHHRRTHPRIVKVDKLVNKELNKIEKFQKWTVVSAQKK